MIAVRQQRVLRPHHGGRHPKVKVFLAIANRIYKGRGERFMSSRRAARQRPRQAVPDEF